MGCIIITIKTKSMIAKVGVKGESSKPRSFTDDYPEIKAYAAKRLRTVGLTDIDADEIVSEAYIRLHGLMYRKNLYETDINKIVAGYRQSLKRDTLYDNDSRISKRGRPKGWRAANKVGDEKDCAICKKSFPLDSFSFNKKTLVYGSYCHGCKKEYQKRYNAVRYILERSQYSDRIVIERLLGCKKYKGGDFDFAFFKFHPELIEQHRQKLIKYDARRAHVTGTTYKERSKARQKYDCENLTDRYITQCINNAKWAIAIGLRCRDIKGVPGLIEYWRNRISAERLSSPVKKVLTPEEIAEKREIKLAKQRAWNKKNRDKIKAANQRSYTRRVLELSDEYIIRMLTDTRNSTAVTLEYIEQHPEVIEQRRQRIIKKRAGRVTVHNHGKRNGKKVAIPFPRFSNPNSLTA